MWVYVYMCTYVYRSTCACVYVSYMYINMREGSDVQGYQASCSASLQTCSLKTALLVSVCLDPEDLKTMNTERGSEDRKAFLAVPACQRHGGTVSEWLGRRLLDLSLPVILVLEHVRPCEMGPERWCRWTPLPASRVSSMG